MKLLKEYAYYPTDRIDISSLDRKTYIGVDNILKNKEGICESEYLPRSGTFTKFKRGDVLIGNIRPYFKKIWLATFAGGASADVVVLRPKNIENSMFIYCNLMQDSFFDYVMSGYKGSKMPRGDKNHILNFPIPDINNKHEIAKLIYKFGEKINVNKRINDNLQQMAKDIYNYWFTQFDFPDENGNPYRSSGGKMVWNDKLKIEIPCGWEYNQLKSVCNLYLGGTPDTTNQSYWNGSINWLNSGEISQFPVVSSELRITEEGLHNSSTKLMKKGTSVVSITGNIRASILAIDTCANQSVVGIEETSQIKHPYLYPYLCNQLDYYTAMSTGNCQKHINKGMLEETLLLIPPKAILDRFYEISLPIYEKITENALESTKLSDLRDWLLPMLMNGQVTIAD